MKTFQVDVKNGDHIIVSECPSCLRKSISISININIRNQTYVVCYTNGRLYYKPDLCCMPHNWKTLLQTRPMLYVT